MFKQHASNIAPNRGMHIGYKYIKGSPVGHFCWIPTSEQLAGIEAGLGKTLATVGANRSLVESAVVLAQRPRVTPASWRKVEGGVAVDAPIFRFNQSGVLEMVAGLESVLAVLHAETSFDTVPGLLV